jgi:hypothetical protein
MTEIVLKNKAELTEILRTISQLALKCDRLLNHDYLAKTDEGYGDQYGDLQKAMVGMIRGSEIAFEELTGVKYQN